MISAKISFVCAENGVKFKTTISIIGSCKDSSSVPPTTSCPARFPAIRILSSAVLLATPISFFNPLNGPLIASIPAATAWYLRPKLPILILGNPYRAIGERTVNAPANPLDVESIVSHWPFNVKGISFKLLTFTFPSLSCPYIPIEYERPKRSKPNFA